MKKRFLPFIAIFAVAVILVGFYTQDPTSSRTPSYNLENVQNPVVPQTDAIVKFVDSLNGANDTVALRSRGYIPKRGPGMGAPGTLNNWFQGNPANWNAFNGPTSGYVSANFNSVSNVGNINLWLILPAQNIAAGDTLSFFERSVLNNTFPDSMRVYYAANGDTVPGSGSFVELGRFLNSIGGAWVERRFTAPTAGANGRFAIAYSVVNGGPNGTNSNLIGVDFIRILGPAAPSFNACSVPELMYYKFENNVGATTPNTALTPVGTNPTPVVSHTFTSQGMYDSSITGSAGTTGVINTGWAPNLGNGSWTIGMWLGNLPQQSVMGTAPMYLFGDVNTTAFRCFWGGAGVTAVDTAILLRKTGQPDLRLVLPNPYNRSYYVHFVYDANTSLLTGYRDGVQAAQVTWTAPNVTGAGPFQIMGYNNTASPLTPGTRMDEFRFYNRALTPAFVTGSWNLAELPGCLTGVNTVNNQVPNVFSLSQNYPNPFNPVTNIKFAIPTTGLVKLSVYDILGREVATLVNEVKPAGNYVADFDASHLASGVYFYSLTSGDFTQTKKMLLVK